MPGMKASFPLGEKQLNHAQLTALGQLVKSVWPACTPLAVFDVRFHIETKNPRDPLTGTVVADAQELRSVDLATVKTVLDAGGSIGFVDVEP